MITPKKVLINIKSRLRTFDENKLNNLLASEQHKLKTLKNNYTGEKLDYLKTPIEQKIQLIEDELNIRKTQQNISI